MIAAVSDEDITMSACVTNVANAAVVVQEINAAACEEHKIDIKLEDISLRKKIIPRMIK